MNIIFALSVFESSDLSDNIMATLYQTNLIQKMSHNHIRLTNNVMAVPYQTNLIQKMSQINCIRLI